MKVLTLYQPLASLAVMGLKTWETRANRSNFRGDLLIHSSKKTPPDAFAKWTQDADVLREIKGRHLPEGAILGSVKQLACEATEAVKNRLDAEERYASKLALALGDFGPNRFAYKWDDPIKFTSYIPATGMQGFWDTLNKYSLLVLPCNGTRLWELRYWGVKIYENEDKKGVDCLRAAMLEEKEQHYLYPEILKVETSLFVNNK